MCVPNLFPCAAPRKNRHSVRAGNNVHRHIYHRVRHRKRPIDGGWPLANRREASRHPHFQALRHRQNPHQGNPPSHPAAPEAPGKNSIARPRLFVHSPLCSPCAAVLFRLYWICIKPRRPGNRGAGAPGGAAKSLNPREGSVNTDADIC